MRKTSPIILALALLACFVVLRSRPEKPVMASVSATSRGPSFEVHVEKPLLNRPFWELPAGLLGVRARGPRFDHTAPGAHTGSVGPGRLELSADGWDLLVETDGKGDTVLFSDTVIVFTSNIGAAQVSADDPDVNNAFIERVRSHFVNQLERPELLGRIGEGNIIPFNFMTDDRFLIDIARSKLEPLRRRLEVARRDCQPPLRVQRQRRRPLKDNFRHFAPQTCTAGAL